MRWDLEYPDRCNDDNVWSRKGRMHINNCYVVRKARLCDARALGAHTIPLGGCLDARGVCLVPTCNRFQVMETALLLQLRRRLHLQAQSSVVCIEIS